MQSKKPVFEIMALMHPPAPRQEQIRKIAEVIAARPADILQVYRTGRPATSAMSKALGAELARLRQERTAAKKVAPTKKKPATRATKSAKKATIKETVNDDDHDEFPRTPPRGPAVILKFKAPPEYYL